MIESQVRALFTEIASGEPGASRVDTQLAHRRGRARLRWRRAGVAGAPVAAAAAVAAVALVVGAASPPGHGSGPVTAGPTAPRQFSVLTPHVSFGWLPAGLSPTIGGTTRQEVQLTAAPKRDSRVGWSLNVDAAGKCHLTGPVSRPGWPAARELKCSTPAQKGAPIPVSGRAPAVRGHHAFWAGLSLIWQYARNGWAELSMPLVLHDSPKLAAERRDAVKIASQVRYGAATPPVLFPVQLTGLPSRWRVSSITYVPDAGVLRASTYALGAGSPNLGADGGLVYETGLPYIDIAPAGPRAGSCYVSPRRSGHETIPGYGVVSTRSRSAREIINGYRVVVTHQTVGTTVTQDLCASNADGLSIYMSESGAHPAISLADLFGHHMRVLGRHPADWTPNPIG